MMDKAIDFARFVYNDDSILNPFPEEIVNRILSGEFLDYYNDCIVNGISNKEYAERTGKPYKTVQRLKNQLHDAFCFDKDVAELYRKMHGIYPKLRCSGHRYRYVCELDFLGLSFGLITVLFIRGKISTVDILVNLIENNTMELWKIDGYGPKANEELMSWYNQYKLETI